jgi:hypothetical protein
VFTEKQEAWNPKFYPSMLIDSMFAPSNCKKLACLPIEYNKVVTGGNNPQISQKMLYAQRARNSSYAKVNGTSVENQLLVRGIVPYGSPTYNTMSKR